MQLIAFGAQDVALWGERERNGGFLYSPHAKKQPKAKQQRIRCFRKFKNHRKKDKYDQHTCCICLERHKAEEFVAVRFCGHIYHQDCNDKSMVACPVCRKV